MSHTPDTPLIQELLSLTCPNCGSKMGYSAEEQQIKCDYCGHLEAYDTASNNVLELSLAEAVHRAPTTTTQELGKKVFDCQSCGSRFMVESDRVKVDCGFCGSRNVNLEAYDHQYIQPSGIIPFKVSEAQAKAAFKGWIGRGIFHPGRLKRVAKANALHGIYIPHWTYDAQTESDWSGEAGFHYYENKRVYVNGKWEVRQVQRTRWERRSGHLSHFFDDVLVVASGGLSQRDMQHILPFRLEEVVNFDPRLMVGWEAEIYNVELDRGYQVADKIMDADIRNMCSHRLGGDVQRGLQVRSEKHGQTFKHVVLPVWISSYRYNDKVYHFVVNGQTGRVHGSKPLSWIRITIAILLGLLIALAIWWFAEGGQL